MLFSTAPWIDPSVLGITHLCPDNTHPLGHLIHLAIKRTLCMSHVCFLSFAWLYMDIMDMLFRGTLGDFYSYQAFVLLMQDGYCKDSDAISVLAASILASVHEFRYLNFMGSIQIAFYSCMLPTGVPKLRF